MVASSVDMAVLEMAHRWQKTLVAGTSARERLAAVEVPSMPQQTLASRVDRLERRVESLEALPEQIARSESQFLQFRDEVRSEFSAVRAEIRAGDEGLRGEIRAIDESLRTEIRAIEERLRAEIRAFDENLRVEIRAVDEETRRQMRVLHEDVIARLSLIQEQKGNRSARHTADSRPKKR